MNHHKTIIWWRLLASLATLNIAIWLYVATTITTDSNYLQWQLILSGIYTAVCAYRSYLPRVDVERLCLVDSFASSIFLGRSAATIAEISFATQVALFIHEMCVITGHLWMQHLAIPIVILLSTAQVFCWAGIVTLNHFWHAVEESIWALTFVLVGICLAISIPQLQGSWRAAAIAATSCTTGYVIFMVTVDVPMYVKRWRLGKAEAQTYMNMKEGVKDALYRRNVSKEWTIWKPEVAWLTGYFTIAVWLSIAMVILPRS